MSLKVRRRDCLRLLGTGAVAGAGAALSGCSVVTRRFVRPEPPRTVALPAGKVEPTLRLVNRVSFGPAPGELARVAAMGVEQYVTEQLYPRSEEPRILDARLAHLEALKIQAAELGDLPQDEVIRQLQQASLLRAVYSPWQLRERMADFWNNHFNIYARKGSGAYFKPTDEQNVVRAHALGAFPDLLRASAHSPAMLQYLDNQVNRRMTAGGGANENYARELMELHSLGVYGGYTQKDVQELARCLTGWTVETGFLKRKGTFRFDAEAHDTGEKVVLGVKVPADARPERMVEYRGEKMPAGQAEGERLLDMLAAHPSTAKFISGKLCRYFLGEGQPAEEWTPRLAAIYLKTGGDIKQMLRPLLLSEELLEGPPILKRPFDYMASTLRALSADTDGGRALQSHLELMGQPLYQWPTPDGYPDRTASWTGSILARWNFAAALAGGTIAGTAPGLEGILKAAKAASPEGVADALCMVTLGRSPDHESVRSLRDTIGEQARKAAEAAKPADRLDQAARQCAALYVSAPEFMWR